MSAIKNYKEAYLAIIDFNKTVITLSSGIMTILISYLVLQDNLSFQNSIPMALLFISIILSLYGFGASIPSVQNSEYSSLSILMSNLGTFIMALGICSIGFIDIKKDPSTNEILKKIGETSKSIFELAPKNCEEIQLNGKDYILTYNIDSTKVKVIYSLIDKDYTVLKVKLKPNNYHSKSIDCQKDEKKTIVKYVSNKKQGSFCNKIIINNNNQNQTIDSTINKIH